MLLQRKRILIILFIAVCSAAVSAALIDDFESYQPGNIRDIANPPWHEVNSGTSYADIESEDANRYLTYGWKSDAGDYVRGAYINIEPIGNSSSAVTLFARIYAESGGINHSFGLSDNSAPGSSMSNYEVQIIGVNDSDDSRFILKANDGGIFTSYAVLERHIWYNIWAVTDQTADTFDIYVTSEAKNADEADKVASGVHFRYGTVSDLVTFFAASYDENEYFRVDDIFLLDGADLHNPLLSMPSMPDVNQDFFVDFIDLTSMSQAWLDNWQTAQLNNADFDNSGLVDVADFGILARFWLDSIIPGLVGWWPLDEVSGYVSYDRVGQNNGVLNNTEPDDRIISGDGHILGLDAQFESDNQGEYVYLPCIERDDFSITFWVRTNQISSEGSQWWHGKGMIDAIATGVRNDFGISLLKDKAAFGVNGSDTGDVTIVSNTSVNDGYWHHIAANRNSQSGIIELFVDGNLEATGQGTTGTLTGPTRMLAGSVNLLNGHYLRGYFDDIRVFDRALLPAEVRQLAQVKRDPVTPKKGVGSKNIDIINALDISWIYNWGVNRPLSPAQIDSSLDYVPMKWGSSWSSINKIDEVGEVYYLLGINEPDKSNQADMTVAEVVDQWPGIQAIADQYNLLLSSPAPSYYASSWIQDFMDIVDTPGSGLRVDFMAVHWYRAPDADMLIDNLNWIHNKWNRDVWITEFNVADWDGNNTYTQQQSYTFMAEALYRMEKIEWLKRYAIFPWDGDTDASKASPVFEPHSTELTPLGHLYNSWDGDTRPPQEGKCYFINNKANHRRLYNDDGTAATATIWDMDSPSQWQLVSAGDNIYYLKNCVSGCYLAYKTDVGRFEMVSSSNSGTNSEWKLSASQHGWYYIDHLESGKRLSVSSDNIAMVSQTESGDSERWRFIKP